MALLYQYRSREADKLLESPIDLSSFSHLNPSIAFVASPKVIKNRLVQTVINDTISMVSSELAPPIVYNFTKTQKFNSWVYNLTSVPQPKRINLIFGIHFGESTTEHNLAMTMLYNSTTRSSLSTFINGERLIQKLRFNNPNADFKLTYTALMSHISGEYVSETVPFFSTFGVLNICNLFVTQIILDRCTERRKYMQSCSLKLPAYWIGCFLSDFIIWALVCFIFWGIYLVFRTSIFTLHPWTTLGSFILSGPGFILLTYCVAFAFDSPDSGASYAFTLMMMPLFLLSSFEEHPNKKIAWVIRQLSGIYPITNLYALLVKISSNTFVPKDFTYIPISIVLFIIALIFIEWVFITAEKTSGAMGFAKYRKGFQQIRMKLASMGAREMDGRAKDESIKDQFSIRIINACRLFFSTKRQPIAAVNHVSLAVEKGSTFGLLGANGAGKTTLMKMILGRTALSDGRIETPNSEIAFCPQFDDHLSPELSALENLRFYGLLFGFTESEITQKSAFLVDALELGEHKDKLIAEMSGGTQRKVAVAVAFLADANIVILDEPTSSLDPMARHCVHRLIKEERSKSGKTCVLCTHLLQEAEDLCDCIAIMLHGCVYTCGSPQALSSFFGKDWKVDVLLQDTSLEMGEKVNKWFADNLPTASLQFLRNRTRVYSVPCSDISLTNLVEKMKEGKSGENGIQYFTCSSSTLEKVFLELIKISDQVEDAVDLQMLSQLPAQNPNPPSNPPLNHKVSELSPNSNTNSNTNLNTNSLILVQNQASNN